MVDNWASRRIRLDVSRNRAGTVKSLPRNAKCFSTFIRGKSPCTRKPSSALRTFVPSSIFPSRVCIDGFESDSSRNRSSTVRTARGGSRILWTRGLRQKNLRLPRKYHIDMMGPRHVRQNTYGVTPVRAMGLRKLRQATN